jgi:hypothetical protein
VDGVAVNRVFDDVGAVTVGMVDSSGSDCVTVVVFAALDDVEEARGDAVFADVCEGVMAVCGSVVDVVDPVKVGLLELVGDVEVDEDAMLTVEGCETWLVD